VAREAFLHIDGRGKVVPEFATLGDERKSSYSYTKLS
jgi:hypothetical protein